VLKRPSKAETEKTPMTNERTTNLDINDPYLLDPVKHPGCEVQDIEFGMTKNGSNGWAGSVSVFRHDGQPDERDFCNVIVHTDPAEPVRVGVYSFGNMALGIGHATFWFNWERAEEVALAILKAAAEHRAAQA
jgi:hypothetical protein